MPNPMKGRTLDRGPPGAYRAPLHTVGQIGPKRHLRSDGSLLCEDVPIARTGTMMYRPGEVPLQPPKRPGAAQILYVTRDRDTLFAPESLGSIVGAPITLDHPPVDVTPANWNQLARGFVLDAWQGIDGDEADLMFADLVVTDKGLIHKINVEGLREVSLGYSAEYEQTGDGEGRQRNIVSNHLALVERGRCGPRCAIGDRQPEGTRMANTSGTGGPRPRVRLQETIDALQTQLADMGNEDEDDGVHVHVHMPGAEGAPGARTADGDGGNPPLTLDALSERIDDITEGMLELHTMLKEALGAKPPADGKTPTGDSAALQTSFTQFISQAEILVPGFKSPTFDSALPRAKTVDAMCAGRRSVLTLLAATTDGAKLLKDVAEDDFDVAKADCSAVATVFKSAAVVKAASNNRMTTGDRMGVPNIAAGQSVVPSGGMKRVTAEDINGANEKYWASQNKSA